LKVSPASYYSYNFKKYESHTTRENHVIFDPTEFKIGDKMYFRVTASEFIDDEMGYEYLDEIPQNYQFIFDDSKHTVEPYHSSDKDDDDDDGDDIRYYKIVKKQEEIGNLQGTYLILYFNCNGAVKIENTKYDQGLIMKIVSIVISVGVAIAFVLIIYFCYCKKKSDDSNDNKPNDNNPQTQVDQVKNQQENPPNSQPNEQYISSNGIYSDQNRMNNNNLLILMAMHIIITLNIIMITTT